jgi:hypothetical protein
MSFRHFVTADKRLIGEGSYVDGSAQAFFHRLVAVVVCSAAGCSFLLRPPDTGKSNDGWRRSGIVLVRFSCFFALPLFAAVSCARLRFKADIRSITGGGALPTSGLIATPFILAWILAGDGIVRPKTYPSHRMVLIQLILRRRDPGATARTSTFDQLF